MLLPPPPPPASIKGRVLFNEARCRRATPPVHSHLVSPIRRGRHATSRQQISTSRAQMPSYYGPALNRRPSRKLMLRCHVDARYGHAHAGHFTCADVITGFSAALHRKILFPVSSIYRTGSAVRRLRACCDVQRFIEPREYAAEISKHFEEAKATARRAYDATLPPAVAGGILDILPARALACPYKNII